MFNNSAFINVFVREVKRIIESKTIFMLSVVLPVILFTFIAYVYKNELIRDIPIAIVDNDNSEVSRTMVRYFESTSAMKVVKRFNTITELQNSITLGEINGGLYIPAGMLNDIKSNKNSTVALYINSSNLIISNYIMNDGVKIIKTVSGGVLLKKLRSKGIPEDRAMNLINAIKVDSHILYNPNYSYESYLTPGLLSALFQMIIMLSAVLLFNTEITGRSFSDLVKTGKGKTFSILAGKSLPHLIIHFATMLFLIVIIFNLFDIRVPGSINKLILFMVLFILSVFLLGVLVSLILKDKQTATEIVLFFNTPAFIFSGFTFPLWSMPLFHQWFAQTIPFTHFITAFIKIYQMDAPFYAYLPEIKIFSGIVLVSSIASLYLLKREIKSSDLNSGTAL